MLQHERQDQGPSRLTVACVLKSGGIYDPFHVFRLQLQVAAHLKRPYRFVCLADMKPECETIPLARDWPGWWSKINLFKPGQFTGRVLYLDLDVSIVGPLEPFFDFPTPFAAIADYQFPLQINSSVMAWDAGHADHLFTGFTPDVIGRFHGDQNYIFERQHDIARFPRRWCPSYRAHVVPNGDKVPEGAKIAVFHGQPKPWDLPAGHWANDVARQAVA